MPTLARSVLKPLKVPSLARSVRKPLNLPTLLRSMLMPRVGEAEGHQIVGSKVRVPPKVNHRQQGTRYDSPKLSSSARYEVRLSKVIVVSEVRGTTLKVNCDE